MAYSKISIAIVGGGITGATLANFLLKYPHKYDVTIYEGAKHFGEIGAGIGLWGNIMETFRDIGLYEAADEIAVKSHPGDPDFAFNLRISDEQPSVEVGPWRYQGSSLFFSRSKLLDVLVSRIPKDHVQFNKRLASYEHPEGEDGPITLHFLDGTSATCDFLIGADGIHSSVRRQMYAEAAARSDPALGTDLDVSKYIEPAWTGSTAFRALISTEELRKACPSHPILSEPQLYFGRDRHLVVYSVNAHQINMVAFVTDCSKEGTQYPQDKWVKDATQEELLEQFGDFDEETRLLLKLMPHPSHWAIHTLKEALPFFTHDNVVLLGDAAHAMTPHLGIGAGVGIQDAFVLASFLGNPTVNTSTDVSLALAAFNTARVHKTAEISDRAKNQGKTYDLRMEGVGRNPQLLMEWVDKNVREIAEWKVEDDIEGGVNWIADQQRRRAGTTFI